MTFSRPHSWFCHLKVDWLSSREWRREAQSQSEDQSGYQQPAVNRLIHQGWFNFPTRTAADCHGRLRKTNNQAWTCRMLLQMLWSPRAHDAPGSPERWEGQALLSPQLRHRVQRGLHKATKLGPKEPDLMPTLISIVHSFIQQIFGHFMCVSGIEWALGNIIPIAYAFK